MALLELLALGYGAKGDSEPGDANAWNNMAPVDKNFSVDQAKARGMYADAFGQASGWKPNASAATVAPTTINRTDLAARGYQQSNANLLADIAAGKTTGVGYNAMQANLNKGMAGNNAMMATRARGNALAGAARTLGNTNSAMMVGSQSGLNAMKAQEQTAAEAALTGQLGGMRAQDMGAASEQARMWAAANAANAGFANQTGIENQYAGLAHDAWKQKALGGLAGYDQNMWENDMAKRRTQLGMSVYDDGMEWRQQQQQDAARGYTADTMGTITGATLKNGSK